MMFTWLHMIVLMYVSTSVVCMNDDCTAVLCAALPDCNDKRNKDNECCNYCADPRPGKCPPQTQENCKNMNNPSCTSDGDCNPDEKCCLKGCHIQCVKVDKSSCPDLNTCTNSSDCTGDDMICSEPGVCCSYRKGGNYYTQPGKCCPTQRACPKIDSSGGGICVQECSTDDDCKGKGKDKNKICCSNGCGNVCTTANTCDYNGKIHNLGDTFKSTDGCNTCTCNDNGLVACTEKGCAPAP